MTGKTLKIKMARLAFTDALFTAKSFKNEAGKEKKYSAKFLIPKNHPQVPEIKAEILRCAQEEWKDKGEAQLRQLVAENKIALTDGDIKPYEGYAGNLVISANNKTRPTYLNRSRAVVEEADGVLYSGCYVEVHLSFWTQNNGFGKRVNCNLLGVRFLQEGEAFSGGGTSSVDDFDEVPGDETMAGAAASNEWM